jgi:hypothetical protein
VGELRVGALVLVEAVVSGDRLTRERRDEQQAERQRQAVVLEEPLQWWLSPTTEK